MRPTKHLGVVAVLVICVFGHGSSAQGLTEQQGTDILQELKEIRRLLEKLERPPSPIQAQPAVPTRRVTLSPSKSPELGNKDASIVLVEFTDTECPFCRTFHITTFQELKRNYIDTGKVRYVARDLPLNFHRNARRTAHAARCAGEQNKYWELRNVMVVNQNDLTPAAVRRYAQDLGLKTDDLEDCIQSGRYEKAIQADITAASTAGLTGTPSFVLGKLTSEGIQGDVIVGAQPFGLFAAKIEDLLRE